MTAAGGPGSSGGRPRSAAANRPPADPFIGKTLADRYRIRALVARGGFGVVYLATCIADDSDVVVKLLSDTWAGDAEATARFEREAKRLSSLRHPNIVSMLDYGHADGRAYLVTEYVPGELLGNFVARHGRLTLDVFVPIAAQILKGVGEAHTRHLMIRDIKANNVMLCELKNRANFVKVLDFGLAKRLHEERRITDVHVMGTIGYLAPEAIRGEDSDLRVDVYAIGVLFYYMLTGVLPFDGNSDAAVIYKTINEEARNLQEVVADEEHLPAGLVDLVHACLAKDREQRPADANAIIETMIDVLPASLFRLPRIMPRVDGRPTPDMGPVDTGLLHLIGLQATGPHTVVPPAAPPTPTPPITTAVEIAPRRSALPWVAAIVCGVLGLGGVAWAMRDTTATPSASASNTPTASTADPPSATAERRADAPVPTMPAGEPTAIAQGRESAAPAPTPQSIDAEQVVVPADVEVPPDEPTSDPTSDRRRVRGGKPHSGRDASPAAAPAPTPAAPTTEASPTPTGTPAPSGEPVFLPATARNEPTDRVFLPADEAKAAPASELLDGDAPQ